MSKVRSAPGDVPETTRGVALMAVAAKRKPLIMVDQDTTDESLQRPEPTYGFDGHHGATGADLDPHRDPEWRRKHGFGPLPKLPPPVAARCRGGGVRLTGDGPGMQRPRSPLRFSQASLRRP